MIRFVPSDPQFDGGCNACKQPGALRALEVGSTYVSRINLCDTCLNELVAIALLEAQNL